MPSARQEAAAPWLWSMRRTAVKHATPVQLRHREREVTSEQYSSLSWFLFWFIRSSAVPLSMSDHEDEVPDPRAVALDPLPLPVVLSPEVEARIEQAVLAAFRSGAPSSSSPAVTGEHDTQHQHRDRPQISLPLRDGEASSIAWSAIRFVVGPALQI